MPRPNVRQMPPYVTKTEAGPLAPWTQYPKDAAHSARIRGAKAKAKYSDWKTPSKPRSK